MIQNHIHLAETLGGSPEHAPIYTWKARDRSRKALMTGQVALSLQGYVYTHVVKRAAVPVVRFDYRYELSIRATGADSTFDLMDRLEGMLGKKLYLVDHRHGDDGTNHSAFVEHVFLADIGEQKVDVNNLGFFYIPVLLNALETSP